MSDKTRLVTWEELGAYDIKCVFLEAELAALRHDLERSMANHNADLAELAALRRDAAIGAIIRRRLVSGNGIPVSRAYVTAQEVHDIDVKETP